MPAILQAPGTAKLSAVYDSSSTNDYPLGTRLITFDGRSFRWGENGGTPGVAGSVYQSEVPTANDDDVAVAAAAAIGDVNLTLTSNSEAIVADEFNGGYFVITDDAGEGYAYAVIDTPSASSATNYTLTLATGIEVALTTSTTGFLLKHPLKDVIIHPSPPTAAVQGAMTSAISANEFGWLQHQGVGSVLVEGTVVIAKMVRASESTDGAVTPVDLDESGRDEAILGVAAGANTSTGEEAPIILDIP